MKLAHFMPILLLAACNIDPAEAPITSRSINYITYNPEKACTGQPVTVSFNNGYNNNCGVSRIQQRINNVWTVVKEAVPQNGIISYSFTPQHPGSYRFRASWNKSGKDCPGENLKFVEEEPLEVNDDCCRDHFTVTPICNTGRECPYALEIHFMTSVENWISITGILPPGYSFCGLYDEYGNIIQEYSGNVMQISGDFPACVDGFFYAYFDAPVLPVSFGTWMVKDMQQVLYQVTVPSCFN